MEFLSSEVISHIFKFLPTIEDRKAASLVCKLWYDAYQNPVFRRDEVLKITSDNDFDELSQLDNPNRVYWNIHATKVDINKNTKCFWERFGPWIKNLSMEGCKILEKSFVNVMLRCDDLQSLSIRDCSMLLISGNLLEDEDDRVAVKKKLYGLKSLDLGGNRYMCDAIFVRFTSICGQLEELRIPDCNISFHAGLYRKYYKNGHSDPSENVFTFPVIYDFVRESAEKLKALSFSNTLIDSDALSSIAQTKDLVLKELNLRGCLQLTNDSIRVLSDFQLSLTHLNLALCPRITDLSLLTICSRLTKLKYLSVQGCRAVTNLGISDLWRLTELSHLDISDCNLIRDEGIMKGLCTRQNIKLEELNLSALSDITDNAIVSLMEFIPNIRTLKLSYCFNAVTDRSVQSIFSNGKHLISLCLGSCTRLTDRGLTGIALKSPPVTVSAPEKHKRIALGSKEEVKIISEDKLKQEVMEICESIGLMSDLSGSCLRNLQHLQHLDLSGCERISDVSLTYAFKLNDLRSLDLSYCRQITSKGMCYLCENNTAIETLRLRYCDNITDEGVFHIWKNLTKLKHLSLGSKQITDNIGDFLGSGCLDLTTLDLSNCPQLTYLGYNKLLSYHPRLKYVHCTVSPNYE